MLKFALLASKQQGLLIWQACVKHNLKPEVVISLSCQPADELAQFHLMAEQTGCRLLIVEELSVAAYDWSQLDLILSCRFSILPAEIFQRPKLGSINVHSSLLPELRGTHPVSWAIINGFEKTGVTIHHINKDIDKGAIICQDICVIKPCDNLHSLTNRLNKLSQLMTLQLLLSVANDNVLPVGMAQAKMAGSNARRRVEQDSQINWQASVKQLINLSRALPEPLPQPFCFDEHGQKVSWLSCEVVQLQPRRNPLGLVIQKDGNKYYIQAEDGVIAVTTASPLVVGSVLR